MRLQGKVEMMVVVSYVASFGWFLLLHPPSILL